MSTYCESRETFTLVSSPSSGMELNNTARCQRIVTFVSQSIGLLQLCELGRHVVYNHAIVNFPGEVD